MVTCLVYIIYSPNCNKYYIGLTQENIKSRIEKHNTSKYGRDKFTSFSDDWELYLVLNCVDYSHAVRLERKIKSMKSRKYIENLKKYDELRTKIVEETIST